MAFYPEGELLLHIPDASDFPPTAKEVIYGFIRFQYS